MLEFVIEVAKRAGQAIKDIPRGCESVDKEGRCNFVTQADLASEKIIVEAIQKKFPNHGILSEESFVVENDPLTIEDLWVIDPLDGTINYRRGHNYSMVSIAYVKRGQPQLGVTYNPFTNELYTAQLGQGAFLNGQRITVADKAALGKAYIATDNSYFPEGTKANLNTLLNLKETPWVLILGSIVQSICEVAAGKLDLYFHTFVKPWDAAASFLIATEAGAVISGMNGEKVNFLSTHAVVSNPILLRAFIDQVSR